MNAIGRKKKTSRRGAGARTPANEAKTEQKTVAGRRRRVPGGIGEDRPPADLILHPPADVTVASPPQPGRTRSAPLVFEAMDLLRSYGYFTARLSEPSIPINIIGLRESGSLLICAVRSRLPVPNAATLRGLFTGKVDVLRGLAGRVKDRIMIWVYSPACGWRYYLVYPGGLRYDLDFPQSIQ